eukprot:jgi/Pico_ML_1/53285/g3857.t1
MVVSGMVFAVILHKVLFDPRFVNQIFRSLLFSSSSMSPRTSGKRQSNAYKTIPAATLKFSESVKP